jgi:hypothetical protein
MTIILFMVIRYIFQSEATTLFSIIEVAKKTISQYLDVPFVTVCQKVVVFLQYFRELVFL